MEITKKNENSLKGKIAIITAGNRGGGAAVAKRFLEAGANCAMIAPLEEGVSAKSGAKSDREITLEVKMSDSAQIAAAVERIHSHFGGIDILINNFSTFNFKASLETSPDEFNKVMHNVFATFFFSQACIPYLKNSQNPHVINIAPPLDMESAQLACENHLLFSISKYGMSFCTMGMAAEFKKFGIAFNSLWQERPVSTATLSQNFENEVVRGSNRPEVYAEASLLISLKSAKEFTGNYCIDEKILIDHGIDPLKFAVDPSAPPIKDIFLPGVDYSVLKRSIK